MPAERTVPTKTGAPISGASNPHACEDGPPLEQDPKWAPLIGDDAIASLAHCTQKLTSPGNLEIAVLFDENDATGRTFATQSTVSDCRVVACVKESLAQVQRPSTGRMGKAVQKVELALTPGKPIQRVQNVNWPLGKTHACTDPNDEVKGFASGRLPPEKIQSVIRERYQDFRKCYEIGLASNPNLSGRVTIRFVIERDGHVSHPYIQGNEIPDCRVAQCIRQEMTKSLFPKPEGGIVTVVYPIQLAPG